MKSKQMTFHVCSHIGKRKLSVLTVNDFPDAFTAEKLWQKLGKSLIHFK